MIEIDEKSIKGGLDSVEFGIAESCPSGGAACVSYDDWFGTPTNRPGVQNVKVNLTVEGARSYGEALDSVAHELRHLTPYNRLDLKHLHPRRSKLSIFTS